jgi:hypothetical protein
MAFLLTGGLRARIFPEEPISNCVNSQYPLVNGFPLLFPASISAEMSLFPNDFAPAPFARLFSGSDTENPGTARNRQGSGRIPCFLPPDSHILWSTGVFG